MHRGMSKTIVLNIPLYTAKSSKFAGKLATMQNTTEKGICQSDSYEFLSPSINLDNKGERRYYMHILP